MITLGYITHREEGQGGLYREKKIYIYTHTHFLGNNQWTMDFIVSHTLQGTKAIFKDSRKTEILSKAKQILMYFNFEAS